MLEAVAPRTEEHTLLQFSHNQSPPPVGDVADLKVLHTCVVELESSHVREVVLNLIRAVNALAAQHLQGGHLRPNPAYFSVA